MGKTVASQLNVVLVADTGEWTMGIEKATASTRKFEAAAKAAARSQAIDQISSPPSRTPNVTASNSIYAQQAAQAEQAIAAQKEIARTRSAQAAQDARSAQIAREASSAWTQRDVTAEKAIADKRAETAAKIAAINAKTSAVSGGSRFDNANPFAQQVMATQKLNALLAQRKTLTDDVARAENRLAITQQAASVRSIRAGLTAGPGSSHVNMEESSKAASRLGVKLQQTGYQVQDFIVQVSSGQNAMVAFAQQGSQLAGALSPNATGAIVGAGLAIGVLAYQVISATKGIKEQTSALDELQSKLKSISKSRRDFSFGQKDEAGKVSQLSNERIKAQSAFDKARQRRGAAASMSTSGDFEGSTYVKGLLEGYNTLILWANGATKAQLASEALKKAEVDRIDTLSKLNDAQLAERAATAAAAAANKERIKEYTDQFEANQDLNRSDQTRLSLIYDQMDALANLGQTGTLAFAQLENASMTLERQINNTRNAETQAAHDRTKAYADAVKANEDLFKTDQQRLDAMDKQIEAMANMGEVGTVAFVNLQGQAEMLAKSIREKGIATLNGLSSRVPQSLSVRAGGQSSGGFVGSTQNSAQTTVKLLQDMLSTLQRIAVGVN